MSRRRSARSARTAGPRWWLGAGIVAGSAAAVVYLFDREHGKARRTRIAQRTAHVARSLGRATTRRVRYLATTVGQKLRHRVMDAEPAFVEGRTLLDRVESELFEDPAIPHGALTFDVEGTTVVLRGQLQSLERAQKIEAAVRRIPGVGDVRNLLHLPGTAAPNKAAALQASTAAGAV